MADENGGRLKNRVVFFADELGTCPPIQSLELMFSASRSRGLMLVPIVQSITGQLQKNYGKEGSEIIVDNCQVNLYGGFAPASQTAVELSKSLGSRTVMSGSISRGKNDPSQSLQMMERPLMTPDELKSMPKGSFIVAKVRDGAGFANHGDLHLTRRLSVPVSSRLVLALSRADLSGRPAFVGSILESFFIFMSSNEYA